MWEMVPIFLSIGLFVLTLIIVFTLRNADSRSRKLEIMRQYVGQYISEVKNKETELHETIAQVEERLETSRLGMEKLVNQITRERESLLAHSEDLEELQKTLAYYHEVLGQLGGMTEQAELRTRQVKNEVLKVEQVGETIEESLAQIAESEERLDQLHERLDHSVEQQKIRLVQQVEESVADAKVKIDILLDDSLNHTDATFQTMITTVQAFLRELNNRTEILEGVVKRLSKTSVESMDMLAAKIDDTKTTLSERDTSLEKIAEKREELEKIIESLGDRKASLDQQIESSELELQDLKDELDVALAERQRIIEEEERKALEMKARLDNPDLAMEEFDSDDSVPLFEPEITEEPELTEEHVEKRRRVESAHFDPEDDEEEIVLDDEEFS
jgi:chromosome segregation ATPase